MTEKDIWSNKCLTLNTGKLPHTLVKISGRRFLSKNENKDNYSKNFKILCYSLFLYYILLTFTFLFFMTINIYHFGIRNLWVLLSGLFGDLTTKGFNRCVPLVSALEVFLGLRTRNEGCLH